MSIFEEYGAFKAMTYTTTTKKLMLSTLGKNSADDVMM